MLTMLDDDGMGLMDAAVRLTADAYFELKKINHRIYGEMLELETLVAVECYNDARR